MDIHVCTDICTELSKRACTACDCTACDYFEDEIKRSVELNESSNFHTDFKPGISCTAKL